MFNCQLINEMYGRRKEESDRGSNPIHHYRIGSLARLISSAVVLLTTPIMADL